MKIDITYGERNSIRKVVSTYCSELVVFMKDVKNKDRFVHNMIANHKETLEFLVNTADEYKQLNERLPYINQRMINIAYIKFYKELPDFDMGLATLETIVAEPDAFIDEYLESVCKDFLPTTTPLEVIGYRKEYVPTHVNYYTDQGNVDEFKSIEHVLLYLTDECGQVYEMNAYESEDSCGSGWCSSDYGNCEITRVERPEITAVPNKGEKIIWNCPTETYLENIKTLDIGKETYMDLMGLDEIDIPGVLNVSRDGGDYYYPCGSVGFTSDLFEDPNIRQMDKVPVWVFKGDSGAGKSYLSHRVKDKLIFETDSYEELPKEILADIIVLGNKYEHTVDELSERIPYEHKIIEVNFSK